jgi:hypothetical protein
LIVVGRLGQGDHGARDDFLDEDDAAQGMVLTCVWCAVALVGSTIPDERTVAL